MFKQEHRSGKWTTVGASIILGPYYFQPLLPSFMLYPLEYSFLLAETT